MSRVTEYILLTYNVCVCPLYYNATPGDNICYIGHTRLDGELLVHFYIIY